MESVLNYEDIMSSSSALASSSSASTSIGAVLVVAVISILLGLILYFTFLSKKNENRFVGFLGWLYDYLTFKKMLVEALLKITYLIITIAITIGSFFLISTSFWAFLGAIILGNLANRIVYEFSLLLLVICRNTTEMNKKLSNTQNSFDDLK